MKYSSEGFLNTAKNIQNYKEELSKLKSQLEEKKDSISGNYQSNTADDLYTYFNKISEIEEDFNLEITALANQLTNEVAPAYAKLEGQASNIGA